MISMSRLDIIVTTPLAIAVVVFVIWVVVRCIGVNPSWMSLRRRHHALMNSVQVSVHDARGTTSDMESESLEMEAHINLLGVRLRRRLPRDFHERELAVIEGEVLLDVARSNLDRFNARLYAYRSTSVVVSEPKDDDAFS